MASKNAETNENNTENNFENDKIEYTLKFKMNDKYIFLEKKVSRTIFTSKVLIEYKTLANINTHKDKDIYTIYVDIDDKPEKFIFRDLRLAQAFSDTITGYILKDIEFDFDSDEILKRNDKKE